MKLGSHLSVSPTSDLYAWQKTCAFLMARCVLLFVPWGPDNSIENASNKRDSQRNKLQNSLSD